MERFREGERAYLSTESQLYPREREIVIGLSFDAPRVGFERTAVEDTIKVRVWKFGIAYIFGIYRATFEVRQTRNLRKGQRNTRGDQLRIGRITFL